MLEWVATESVSAMTARCVPVLIDAALKGTLLLALAGTATLLMRRASAASRHLVWFLAVGGTLVLPVLSATFPEWEILPRWVDLPDQGVLVQEADDTVSPTEVQIWALPLVQWIPSGLVALHTPSSELI